MLRTFWFQLMVVLHQIWLLPRLVVAEYLVRRNRVPESRMIGVKMARQWSKMLLWAAGCRVRVHGTPGIPPGKGVLVVSNHQGMFDIPLIGARLGVPNAFVAKAELARIPLVGRWMRLVGCVFLVREDRRQAVEAVRDTIARLHEGISMVIFPEGTRSNSATLGEFRRGSANIAVKAGVPILPVTVNHTWKMRVGDKGRVSPAEVDIHFHPLVETANLSPEEREALSERLRAIIAGPLAESAPPAPR